MLVRRLALSDMTCTSSPSRRDPYGSVRYPFWIVGVLVVFVIQTRASVQGYCDTTIWTLDRQDIGVQDVKGTCSEGRIVWHSPSGAIRLTLDSSRLTTNQNENRSFEACLLVSVRATTIQMFLDDARTTLKRLTVLTPGAPSLKEPWCLVSQSAEPIVLYIESDITVESSLVGLVTIDYEITPLIENPGQRHRNDCRPCTEREILEAVCSSDVVFAGTMADVVHDPDIGESALHLDVTRIIRQKRDVITSPRRRSGAAERASAPRRPGLKLDTGSEVVRWIQNDAAPSASPASFGGRPRALLHAPYHCAIKEGRGEFLFTAKVRFRKAYLHCAPRMRDFVDLWREAKRNNHVLCSLE